MTSSAYEKELLTAWEEVFKKGQLTLWTLLALKDAPKQMTEISQFIERRTHGTLAVEDQSLYRALRRYHEAHMVDFIEQPSEQGPMHKVYNITTIGRALLQDFLDKNIIGVYYTPENEQLILHKNNR